MAKQLTTRPLSEPLPPPNALPPELRALLIRNAEEDADGVIELLKTLGFPQPVPGGAPVRLSAAFLLGLGIALRMMRWPAWSGIVAMQMAGWHEPAPSHV
jgi:hypothetical protein